MRASVQAHVLQLVLQLSLPVMLLQLVLHVQLVA